MKSFAIIGLGLFGTELATKLYNDGHNVLAIDINEEIIEEIADNVSKSVTMDAKNRAALSQLGINKYDCVVVSISEDLATSVIVTMNLKALNVQNIVCKVQNETDIEILETLGASLCVIPEQIAATKVCKRLTSKNVLDFTQLSENHSIIEMNTPSNWVGKSIKALDVRAKYGVNVIALRVNGNIQVAFDPDSALNSTDELIVIGTNKDIDKLLKL